jgi:polyisoprenoid-binding protein YceI
MTLVIPLKTLNSQDAGLDKNAYQALQVADHPEIKFELTSETLTAGTVPDAYVLTALGTVTVAGQSAPVTLTADTTFQNDQVRLKGVQKLKMTDFKITPPKMSILIVTVTCTDEIEIHYDVTFGDK